MLRRFIRDLIEPIFHTIVFFAKVSFKISELINKTAFFLLAVYTNIFWTHEEILEDMKRSGVDPKVVEEMRKKMEEAKEHDEDDRS